MESEQWNVTFNVIDKLKLTKSEKGQLLIALLNLVPFNETIDKVTIDRKNNVYHLSVAVSPHLVTK